VGGSGVWEVGGRRPGPGGEGGAALSGMVRPSPCWTGLRQWLGGTLAGAEPAAGEPRLLLSFPPLFCL